MNLAQHPMSGLVRALPVRLHAVRVSRALWEPRFARAGLSTEFNEIFGEAPEIRLSRNQIFQQADARRKCLEVLLWGYPSGMRGNERAYLENLGEIVRHASSEVPWTEYFANLNALKGLGISTITKLAYFFEKSFGESPAIILDSVIIRVFKRAIWAELKDLHSISYVNAPQKYPRYLQLMTSVAREIKGAKPDQLEFFLFSLGDAFNPPLAGATKPPALMK